MKAYSVGAIVILYNPDVRQLAVNLSAVVAQAAHVILVDNSPARLPDDFWKNNTGFSGIRYIFNNENAGVAKGQNIGIREGLAAGWDFVVIFDQDSTPHPGMVDAMVEDYLLLQASGLKIAAIGPQPLNKQTGKPYEPRIRKRAVYTEAPHIQKTSELISSGCLIYKDVLHEVGLMDEKLFIDGVDHEWCWRAARAGYSCGLTSRASLQHMLGEGDKKFFGVRIAITSPFRVYYQYRNFILLCRRSYVPLYWKLNNLVKYLIKIFYYPLLVPPGKLYLKNMIRGLRAGFADKS